MQGPPSYGFCNNPFWCPMLIAALRPRLALPLLAVLLAAAPGHAQAPVTPTTPAMSVAPAPQLATSRDFTFAAEDKPVRLDQVAGHIQVFILEDLERSGARTLGDFLGHELPDQFQQGGGPGLVSRAYQGGARPQDTLILLDGVRLTDPNQIAPDLEAIPLTGIVRVEILNGADSSRLGPGAEGGVIALFTAGSGGHGSFGELAAQGGGEGESQGRALPSFGWGGGWLHVGSQARKMDQATDTPMGYRSATSFATFGQRLGPALLTFSYRNAYEGVPDPYALTLPAVRVYDPQREASYRSESGSMGLRFDLSPATALVFTLGGQAVDRWDPKVNSLQILRTTGRSTQAEVAFVVGVPSFGLTVHAGGFEERGEQPVAFVGTDEGKTRHAGFGAEAVFAPLPILRFTAEAGLQQDRRELNPVGLAANDRTDHASTFRATMNLGLPLGFRFYAGGGQGYTAPTLPQLLVNARAGAPDLDVEKSGFGFAGFGWGKGNWSGRLVAHRTSYQNAIGFNGTTYANDDHVRVQGTEAALGYTRGGYGAEGFARAQEARDLNTPTDPYGTATVSGRPFHSHGLKIHGGGSVLRVDLSYRTLGATTQVAGPATRGTGFVLPLIKTTTYQVMDATATLTLGKHWNLIARGRNLLQKRTTVDEWLAASMDQTPDAYRTYGLPAMGPNASLEVIFRY